MATDYTIANARMQDLPFLSAIERAAAALLEGHAPASVLDEATEESALREAQAHGRLWVALVEDAPVGFALVEMLADDLPHLDEIDVLPAYGRRGIGAALVQAVCAWVRQAGYSQITLTTFRDVPWNMPFYSRLGFQPLLATALRDELRAVVADETARGLDPARRVVMVYRRRPGST